MSKEQGKRGKDSGLVTVVSNVGAGEGIRIDFADPGSLQEESADPGPRTIMGRQAAIAAYQTSRQLVEKSTDLVPRDDTPLGATGEERKKQ